MGGLRASAGRASAPPRPDRGLRPARPARLRPAIRTETAQRKGETERELREHQGRTKVSQREKQGKTNENQGKSKRKPRTTEENPTKTRKIKGKPRENQRGKPKRETQEGNQDCPRACREAKISQAFRGGQKQASMNCSSPNNPAFISTFALQRSAFDFMRSIGEDKSTQLLCWAGRFEDLRSARYTCALFIANNQTSDA